MLVREGTHGMATFYNCSLFSEAGRRRCMLFLGRSHCNISMQLCPMDGSCKLFTEAPCSKSVYQLNYEQSLIVISDR